MEEIKLLNNAYKIYNLDNREDLSNKILNYISTRIIANRFTFEQMIKVLNADISFYDILNTFNNAYKEKEYYKENISYKQGTDYYSGILPMPIGNIVVETNDVLEVIKYFVRGIKSRNTITISQTEYNELSLSNMILIIFVEALAKFNISRNTLMILPFEECFYDEFDEVIILENENTIVKQKEFSKISIIYEQDTSFANEIKIEEEKLKENNIIYKVINGNFDDALNTIKKQRPVSVSIYTKSSNIAYDFINLAHSQNIFVNSSILNSEKLDNKNNLYYKKKIMYPSGKTIDLKEYYKEYSEKGKSHTTETKTNITSSNTALSEIINPWYKKIFEKIKNIFLKK